MNNHFQTCACSYSLPLFFFFSSPKTLLKERLDHLNDSTSSTILQTTMSSVHLNLIVRSSKSDHSRKKKQKNKKMQKKIWEIRAY